MESNSRPKYIQVESTLEFSRLVCALERMPRVSFLHEHKGSKVLSVQIDLLKEKPVIYYTPNSDVGHYLCYGFKSGKEYASIVENTNAAFTPCACKLIATHFLYGTTNVQNTIQKT